MKRRDLIDLLLLAAAWGGSFLFMRIAVPEFGPMPMVEVRVAIPPIGMLYGAIFLRERVAVEMIAGCVVILLGTALATGIVGARTAREAVK